MKFLGTFGEEKSLKWFTRLRCYIRGKMWIEDIKLWFGCFCVGPLLPDGWLGRRLLLLLEGERNGTETALLRESRRDGTELRWEDGPDELLLLLLFRAVVAELLRRLESELLRMELELLRLLVVGIETAAAVAAAGMAGTDGTIGELPRRGSKLDEVLDALVEERVRQEWKLEAQVARDGPEKDRWINGKLNWWNSSS